MKIVINADDRQWQELGGDAAPASCIRVQGSDAFSAHSDAAAYIDLSESRPADKYAGLQKPVFINSIVYTLRESAYPGNVLRINGWPGCIARPVWEVAGASSAGIAEILDSLGKKPVMVKDEPGFVSARVIAMIINEAYFALEEAVSTKAEIDIAMKLGTNYPYGPFEWCEKIGIKRVYELLLQLSANDLRCRPAALLSSEAALSL